MGFNRTIAYDYNRTIAGGVKSPAYSLGVVTSESSPSGEGVLCKNTYSIRLAAFLQNQVSHVYDIV